MKNEKPWHYYKRTTESLIIFHKSQSLCCKQASVYKTIDKILKKDGTGNTKCFEKYTGIDFDEFVNIWCKKKDTMKSVDLIIGVNNKENKNKDKKYVLLIENKYKVTSPKQMKDFSDLENKYKDSITVLQELSLKNILSGYIATDAINIKEKLVILARNNRKRDEWRRQYDASTQKVTLEISTSEKFYKDYFSSSQAS